MDKPKGAVILAVLVMGSGMAWGQAFEPDKFAQASTDWQVSAITGFFTGGRVWEGLIGPDQVPASVETDGGVIVGLRFGADQEYLGWEITFAGVFEDLDINSDAADYLPSANDATWLLGNVNALWFPFGNNLAQGRVRPFLTAGPGVAHFNSDLSEVDNETLFDVNVGMGIKFFLGDEGNPVLRVDWRWHMMDGSSADMESRIYRQELSAGIGIKF